MSATAQGAAEAPTALRSQACSSADPSPASDLRWDWCSTARPAHFIISATGLDLISATADANHSWRKAKKNTQRGRERQRQRQMQGQDRDRDVGRNTDTHTDTDTHTHTETENSRPGLRPKAAESPNVGFALDHPDRRKTRRFQDQSIVSGEPQWRAGRARLAQRRRR